MEKEERKNYKTYTKLETLEYRKRYVYRLNKFSPR